MTEDMLSWLRREVEAEKTTAPSVHGDNCAHVVHAGYYPCNCPVPQDTIARCEAELAILDDMIPILDDFDTIADGEGLAARHPRRPGEYMCEFGDARNHLIRLLAYGYRHRPGYLPEWAPEGDS